MTAEAPLDIEHPCSDGVAISETDFQARAVTDAKHVIKTHFRNRPDVYVSGNLFVHHVEGNTRQSVSPDILVSFEVGRRDRSIYKICEEGKEPDFVLEVASPSTRARDLLDRREPYAELGVREHFLFGPMGDPLRPSLQGYRLDWGRSEPLPLSRQHAVLGLELWEDQRAHLRIRPEYGGEPALGRRLGIRSARGRSPWRPTGGAAQVSAEPREDDQSMPTIMTGRMSSSPSISGDFWRSLARAA